MTFNGLKYGAFLDGWQKINILLFCIKENQTLYEELPALLLMIHTIS